MTYRFKLTATIPASPRQIYDAWLDSRRHRAMTGGKAKQSAKVGAPVTAWNGYISGKNLELVPGRRIVQAWRTTKFTDADRDSKATVPLKPVNGGPRLTLSHSAVPDGHTSYEKGGWQSHYFEPMKKFFVKQKTKRAAERKRRAARKKRR